MSAMARAIASSPDGGAMGVGAGRSMVSVMEIASLATDDEAVDAAIGRLLDQLMAGRSAPGREVAERARVGREHLDEGARGERPDRGGRPDDGHGAREPS